LICPTVEDLKGFMKKLNPIHYKLLRKTLTGNQLGFETTAELQSLTEFVGQERALESIVFGIGIKSHGYNIYAMGPTGIGKRSIIRYVLESHAIKQPVPNDWCYVHNFDFPEKPIAIELPAGQGIILQQDMKMLMADLSTSILAVFESDEYRNGIEEINTSFNKKRGRVNKKTSGHALNNKIPHLYKQRHEREKELQIKLIAAVVGPIINKLKTKYAEFTSVFNYLSVVENNIVYHVNDFIKPDEVTNELSFTTDNFLLSKYQINLIINNEETKGAPVVFEEHPSYSNLICRIEHAAQNGNLVTNFTLIKGGAVHRANGGYLVIEARKIKKEKDAWDGLMRILHTKKIIIEAVGNEGEAVRPISLEPVPIPLNIKIILLGDRHTYYSLSHHDPNFSELFKVCVDFDEQIDRNPTNINLYARLIGTIARREKLRPFHANAVAKIIDYCSRLAEDTEKLSTHIRGIDDVILESDYWASLKDKKIVQADDVKRALKAKIYRMARTRDLYYEEIQRHFVMINTEGKRIGQVNCLSVVKAGKFSYGHPTRVTATARMGTGKIIDIQREIKLAGPSHSKASFIVSSYLSSYYNKEHSFSLSASISFEQIYGMMDGDSASVAEVCALLSVLANVPIKQNIAVTGSIDQHGQVQAIGCVNEKIEGFYDICKQRGLTGSQGVLIPFANLQNLMLREDIVEASKNQQFFIFVIETVNQAFTLLTGKPAGERVNNHFKKGTLNYKIEKELERFTKDYLLEKKQFLKKK
jgi:lon-related putative ATP-dependent protease